MIYKNTGLVLYPYYLTTIVHNPMKEKGLKCSKGKIASLLLNYYITTLLILQKLVILQIFH